MKELRDSIRQYLELTKPGIIIGNLITTVGGFFLASRGEFNPPLFISAIGGLACVMASACVVNNYMDRGIDARMERTKGRPSATGLISLRSAMVYAFVLALLGFGSLYFFTNILTACIAILGYIFYVVIYGIGKRKSIHGTLIGSISGAVPPVVGYCAVANRFDIGAFLLFLILVAWQMPHFYAIAIRRQHDYENAHIPVLPAVKGVPETKRQILLYVGLFLIAASALSIYGYTKYSYLFIIGGMAAYWLLMGLKGFSTSNNILWAKKMFGFSLLTLLVWSVLISVSAFVPF